MTEAMSLTEQERKLRMIAEMPADQIPGYHAYALERGLFEGELAAITRRKKELKVKT